MLTKQQLEDRLEQLKANYRRAMQEHEEALKRALAYDGAIQECEWTLAQLDETKSEQEGNLKVA